MPSATLCVVFLPAGTFRLLAFSVGAAERPGRHSHAERGELDTSGHLACETSLIEKPVPNWVRFLADPWSHHDSSRHQIPCYAFHDWLRFLLFFSRLARPDCDQSGESGLRSDRLTISSADPIHSNVCVQPPHAPRRGDRPQPARPVPSSALAQTHRRGGGHAGRPVFPRPNSRRRHSSNISMRHVCPTLADSCRSGAPCCGKVSRPCYVRQGH